MSSPEEINPYRSLSPLERRTRSLSPPLQSPSSFRNPDRRLSEEYEDKSDQPFAYGYLLGLFSSPDMGAFLTSTSFSDEIQALPFHWQTLISEAKDEVIQERTQHSPLKQHPAMKRLENVRQYVWMAAGNDSSNLPNTLTSILHQDDQLWPIIQSPHFFTSDNKS